MILIQNTETNEEKTIKPGESFRPPWKVMRSIPTPVSFKETDPNLIKLGDLGAKILQTTGFKDFWDRTHGGDCKPCQERQGLANYVEFKGPKWLSDWIEDVKLKD